jgi:HD-GYP domain-containing protein (c-di-GMP phosphodiesterase class II)
MVSDRPYRKGLSADMAIGELTRGRETQFDAEIIDIFIDIL